MTVAHIEDHLPAPTYAVADYQSNAVQRLGEWARSADAAYTVAERLVQTSFVPQAFRNKPIEATAAILAGTEVGLSPMSALRAFDVIQGQAAARAITLRAIVQSHGHQMVLVESTTTRCRMKGRRRGADEWITVSWTIDRARELQLTGKDNWKKQPAAMLIARATSELARLVAADAILGIGYSFEEISDGADPDSQPVQPDPEQATQPTGTRRMSRRTAPEPAPADEDVQEAELDDQPEPEQPQDEAGITSAQSKMLHASYNDAGINERQDRLDYAASIIGHPIDTSNDLTKTEASKVIDTLVQLKDRA